MSNRRASFLFPREAVVALECIRSQTRHNNGIDVIRVAVSTYSQILYLYDIGNKILVRDREGEEFSYSPYRPFKYPGMPADPSEDELDMQHVSQKSFSFSGDVLEKIDQIKARGHVATNAEAVRAALAAYKELIAIVSVGDSIIVRSDLQEFKFNPDAPYANQGLKRLDRTNPPTNAIHAELAPGG